MNTSDEQLIKINLLVQKDNNFTQLNNQSYRLHIHHYNNLKIYRNVSSIKCDNFLLIDEFCCVDDYRVVKINVLCNQ